VAAAQLPVGAELVASGFFRPLLVAAPPGDHARLFVMQQYGRVRVLKHGALLPTPYLDLFDEVSKGGEQGTLGLAFDPDYAQNGHVYVLYTDLLGDSVLERFSASAQDPDVVDMSTRKVLLGPVYQPQATHNGSCLAFGPDGMLYVASGDGGSGNDPGDRAQSLGTVLGKVLRLQPVPGDVVPADNPFVGQAGARGEIWAYGLRNPWRFGFDRATGLLWAADVGQNAREEIDVITAGGNYGWRVYEGTRSNLNPGNIPPSAFVAPVFEYDHGQGQSVTGGYVYRGLAVPELAGRYVYGDFVSGHVWSFAVTGTAASDNRFIGDVANPSSFGEDAAGELFITAFDGRIYRLESAPD
jgi:hypothetical protein